jgi:hypothetical protein
MGLSDRPPPTASSPTLITGKIDRLGRNLCDLLDTSSTLCPPCKPVGCQKSVTCPDLDIHVRR